MTARRMTAEDYAELGIPDPTAALECEACDATDADGNEFCDGCGCCSECCNCTSTDCDCSVCEIRRELEDV